MTVREVIADMQLYVKDGLVVLPGSLHAWIAALKQAESNRTAPNCMNEICPKCGNRVWVAGISSECKIVHKCVFCNTMYDSNGKLHHA